MPTAHAPRPLARSLLGMVHVGALPATPHAKLSVGVIVERAAHEARVLRDAGFQGVIVENMHDRPYANAPHDPAVVSCMTRCVEAVRGAIGREMVLGVQVLSGGEVEAMAIAHACGADFIRCENFVFAHVADEGLLARAAAGPLLRYRRALGATRVRIYADIQKKHASHALTADLTIADLAHAAEFFSADGVIVTGAATGKETDAADVRAARGACGLPVLVGSGVTPESAASLLEFADALIVGSWIKRGGRWDNPVDAARAKEMARAVKSSGARR